MISLTVGLCSTALPTNLTLLLCKSRPLAGKSVLLFIHLVNCCPSRFGSNATSFIKLFLPPPRVLITQPFGGNLCSSTCSVTISYVCLASLLTSPCIIIKSSQWLYRIKDWNPHFLQMTKLEHLSLTSHKLLLLRPLWQWIWLIYKRQRAI